MEEQGNPDVEIIDLDTPQQSSSSFGMSDLISYTPILTQMLGIGTQISDIKQRNQLIKQEMQNAALALNYKQYNEAKRLQDLYTVVGDKMSMEGFNAMQNEARLKAASAETGASGTSNTEAIQQAEVRRLHNTAVVLRDYEVSKTTALKNIVAERLNFNMKLDSIRSSQQSWQGAGLQTLNAGLSGLRGGLGMLPQSQVNKFFNINTTG